MSAARLNTSQSEGNLSNSRLSDARREKLINLKKREDLKGALEKLNVNMTSGYFSTEVPDAFQLPISAKWLAMSQTVDAVIVAHGGLTPVEKTEALKNYQSVSLNFNVPIVPCSAEDSSEQVAAVAVSMAEIRMQALMGAGPRQSSF